MKASGTNPGSSDTTGLNQESYMLISISLIHFASWTARTNTCLAKQGLQYIYSYMFGK
jgi:hypothetical protein